MWIVSTVQVGRIFCVHYGQTYERSYFWFARHHCMHPYTVSITGYYSHLQPPHWGVRVCRPSLSPETKEIIAIVLFSLFPSLWHGIKSTIIHSSMTNLCSVFCMAKPWLILLEQLFGQHTGGWVRFPSSWCHVHIYIYIYIHMYTCSTSCIKGRQL